MSSNLYSDEIGKKIIEKVNSCGWNIYHSTKSVKLGADEIIKNKLVKDNLQVNERYALLPAVSNPQDPKEVFSALERLAIKLNRQMPTIQVGNDRYPLTGFKLMKTDVKIISPKGIHVSYDTFLNSLDSLIQN